ncbi:rhomboid family intramembrane serine protease [Hymenobacter busanensis]|uniref:Rhomboid family intramembrane serine protease n=1 Tax=Hymenobacter busanensis TaxID=2607656 RepID=A0A7L4ZVW0_9BACT|nr:rhomboid family intramembrane serine protease [Hymenobacter busanensis]KAA9332302.1 rhomboid family intramembrane serine protease [Hymenobacter busanensis]QHJ07361.1 rhomboid family intramembrane serine protease [Hymenobacter busanensis]
MSIIADIKTAFSRRDNALNQLLLINVLVFAVLVVLEALLFLSGGNSVYAVLMRQLELPADLPGLLRHPWTLLTYAFTHVKFFHILFNMLNLYWFGMLLREYLGDRRLVSLYILGALAGAVLFLLSYNLLPVLRPQMMAGISMIGASASVTAIIVGAATLLPDYTFNLFLFGPVRIKYIAAAVVLISIAGISGTNAGGQIAHIGGAIIGFLFVKQLQAGRDLGRPILAVGDWVSGLLHGRPRLRVSHRNTPAPAASGKRAPLVQPEQNEIDLILDKISRSGYESLSKDEKQKLFKASQQ